MSSEEVLTKAECETVLKRALNGVAFRMTDRRIVSLSNTVSGFLGEYFKMDVEFVVDDRRRSLKYFIKRKPSVAVGRNVVADFVNESNAFDKEVFFYERVVAGATLDWAPTFHYSKRNELVVLDDLTHAGCRAPPRVNELTVDYCEVALDTVAKFHAHCIAYERDTSSRLGRPYRCVDEHPDSFVEVLFDTTPGSLRDAWMRTGRRCLRAFVDRHPPVDAMSRDAFAKLIDKKFVDVVEHVRPSTRYFNTISHGDIWSNNLLFTSNAAGDPERCYLIDYQLMRYNPPANDVLMFIMFNTSLEFQNERMSELISYYYARLVDELDRKGIDCARIIPRDQFVESCGHFASTWKLVRCIYLSVHVLGDDVLADVLNDPDKYGDMMFYRRDEMLIEFYENDAVYRERVVRMIDDLRDALLNDALDQNERARSSKERLAK